MIERRKNPRIKFDSIIWYNDLFKARAKNISIGGIAFIAGSSAAINQILDFKYDSVMERTVKRPIVTGKISVTSATVFASFLFLSGSVLILYFNNFLTWALTFATWIFYAFFYTKVLKFSGSQNIVIGGLAGAMPPLLGWTAVVG